MPSYPPHAQATPQANHNLGMIIYCAKLFSSRRQFDPSFELLPATRLHHATLHKRQRWRRSYGRRCSGKPSCPVLQDESLPAPQRVRPHPTWPSSDPALLGFKGASQPQQSLRLHQSSRGYGCHPSIQVLSEASYLPVLRSSKAESMTPRRYQHHTQLKEATTGSSKDCYPSA